MTPSATNGRAAEVLINHVSAETLNTGRMTPSATNSTAALTWFIRTSAAVLLIAEGIISASIQCLSTGMVY
jgi:hypothetical protein